jgi:hypothetical protein
MDKNYIKTSKITLAIGLVLIILALLYVYGASNPKQIVTDENIKIGIPSPTTITTTPIPITSPSAYTPSPSPSTYPQTHYPKPVPPDFGIRIFVETKNGIYRYSFKEKSVILNITLIFRLAEGFNETVKIGIKKYSLVPLIFAFGWNGTHFVFGELEKQCKIRLARPVNYEVFFDKTEFYVGPNLNTELNVILKIYETPIDPKMKTGADVELYNNPNYVLVNESNFGAYAFTIIFDDYGYWNKYPEKGYGLWLVEDFVIEIDLGGYIQLTKELYEQLYAQNKELIDQIEDYFSKNC